MLDESWLLANKQKTVKNIYLLVYIQNERVYGVGIVNKQTPTGQKVKQMKTVEQIITENLSTNAVAATFKNGAVAIESGISKKALADMGLKKIGMFGYGHQVVNHK